MFKRILSIAVIISAAFAGPLMGSAFASDNAGMHICLRSHAKSCLDLKGDSFTNGTTVVMFGPSGGGLGWSLVKVGTVCAGGKCGKPWPFKRSSASLNGRYKNDKVFVIHKTKGKTGEDGCLAGLALEGGERAGHPVWGDCIDNSGRALFWVDDSSGRLVAVAISNNNNRAEVMSATGTRNGSAVYLVPPGTRGYSQQWKF